MSKTQIKRGKAPPRRPARAPKKRKTIKTSRLNAVINALPISPQRLQKVANWTIGLSLFAVAGIAAHATGVTAKALALGLRPIVVLNLEHYFDPLLQMLRQAADQRRPCAARAHHDVVVGGLQVLGALGLVGADGVQLVGEGVQAAAGESSGGGSADEAAAADAAGHQGVFESVQGVLVHGHSIRPFVCLNACSAGGCTTR